MPTQNVCKAVRFVDEANATRTLLIEETPERFRARLTIQNGDTETSILLTDAQWRYLQDRYECKIDVEDDPVDEQAQPMVAPGEVQTIPSPPGRRVFERQAEPAPTDIPF